MFWLRKHKDRILSELFVAALLASSVFLAVQIRGGGNLSEPTLYLLGIGTTVERGGEAKVYLRENTSGEQVRAVQATLTYDTSQLEFIGFEENGPFSQVWASSSADSGVIRLARAVPVGERGVSGEHNVVTLKFKVLVDSGGAPLRLNKAASLLIDSRNSADILAATGDIVLRVAGRAVGRSPDN